MENPLSLLSKEQKMIFICFVGTSLIYLIGILGSAICSFIWLSWVNFYTHLSNEPKRIYSLLCIGGLFVLFGIACFVTGVILKKIYNKDLIAKLLCLASCAILFIAFCSHCYTVSKTSNNDGKCKEKFQKTLNDSDPQKLLEASTKYSDLFAKIHIKVYVDHKYCGFIYNRCIAFVILEGLAIGGFIAIFIYAKYQKIEIDNIIQIFF